MPAGFQRYAGGIEMVDNVGDHLRATLGDRHVQVGVGDQTHPLVPRVVPRFEVGVDVVAVGQVAGRNVPYQPLDQPRRLAGEETEHRLCQGGVGPDNQVGSPTGQHFASDGGDPAVFG